jgi:hypothetical protein
MKFSRLLAAGRCMVGMRDTNSPYKVLKTSFLPKFESSKNPFHAPTRKDITTGSEVQDSRNEVASCELRVANGGKTGKVETAVVSALPSPSPSASAQKLWRTGRPAPPIALEEREKLPSAAPAIMETRSLFDMEARLVPLAAAKPVATIPVNEAKAEKPIEIKVEVKAAIANGTDGTDGTNVEKEFSSAGRRPLTLRLRSEAMADKQALSPDGGQGENSLACAVPEADAPTKERVEGLDMEKAVARTMAVTKPVARAATSVRPGLLAGLIAMVNPLAYLPGRRPDGGVRGAKQPRTAVQTELSLEKVRVMRNDLNETDLEVVAARPVSKVGESGDDVARAEHSAAKPRELSRLVRVFRAASTALLPRIGTMNRSFSPTMSGTTENLNVVATRDGRAPAFAKATADRPAFVHAMAGKPGLGEHDRVGETQAR